MEMESGFQEWLQKKEEGVRATLCVPFCLGNVTFRIRNKHFCEISHGIKRIKKE